MNTILDIIRRLALSSILFILFAELTLAGKVSPPTRPGLGTQAIGLANWSAGDVDLLMAQMRGASTSRVELAFLPFTFQPDSRKAFSKMKRATRQFLPRSNKKLWITIHLWFDHGRDAYFLHSAFTKRASRRTAQERQFIKEFNRRTIASAQAMEAMRSWAAARGYEKRLRFNLCPELEDDIPSVAAFQAAVKQMEKLVAKHAPAVKWAPRRSVNGPMLRYPLASLRAPGASLEIHDANRINELKKGDVYSPDGDWVYLRGAESSNSWSDAGEKISHDSLNGRARFLKSRKVSTLNWLPAFNGLHRGNKQGSGYKHPSTRGRLYPFTRSQGQFNPSHQQVKNTSLLKS